MMRSVVRSALLFVLIIVPGCGGAGSQNSPPGDEPLQGGMGGQVGGAGGGTAGAGGQMSSPGGLGGGVVVSRQDGGGEPREEAGTGQLDAPKGDASLDQRAVSDATANDGASAMVGSEGNGKFTIKSPFTPDPAQVVKAGTPRGQRVDFTMNSADSTIYPASGSAGAFARPAAVYLPSGYLSGKEVPFMVVQDGLHGTAYINTMPAALDNLIHDKRIPAMAVVFVDPGPNGERSVEYDTVSDAYTKFVESELLPAAKAAVKSKAGVDLALTSNPEGRGTMGGSSGGACAFTMGWFHPELYRRILSYSGSFVKLRPDKTYPDGAAAYHLNLIAAAATKPLRVFLEVGSNDLDNQFGSWPMANDAMVAALAAKGYPYRYVVAQGAGHVEGGVLTQTLADALVWLWHGYPL